MEWRRLGSGATPGLGVKLFSPGHTCVEGVIADGVVGAIGVDVAGVGVGATSAASPSPDSLALIAVNSFSSPMVLSEPLETG